MKLTPKFPPHILPVRSGVYMTTQIDPETGEPTENGIQDGYSYFDVEDRVWGCSAVSVQDAEEHPEYEFAWQHKSWQGLAEEQAA